MADCPKCSSRVAPQLRFCEACQNDLGAPNVRENRDSQTAVAARFRLVAERVEKVGKGDTLKLFSEAVSRESVVVVSMPINIALLLASDPKALYQGYEELVGSGARCPADSSDDKNRCGIGGFLFGSYAKKIRYGALSFSGIGLQSYGPICFELKSKMIDERVSFLEWNSYDAFKKFGASIPAEHKAIWGNRHELACVKHEAGIASGAEIPVLKKTLLSPGKDRASDDFIEAHIFEGFNIRAVDKVFATRALTRNEGVDHTLIEAALKKQREN